MSGTCGCSGDGRKPRSSHRRRRTVLDREWSGSGTSTSDSEVEASPYVAHYTGPGGCTETGSVRHVDTVCGTHTYTVVGYTLARAMGPGTRLCSDLFEVGGQMFRLEVYPAGLSGDTHKYVSLFLTTPGSRRPGHLLYELSILDKCASKPQHITESRTAQSPCPSEAAAIQAPHAGVVAGFPKFIKANFLHRNARRFLPSDTLTIRATIRVLTGRSSFPVTTAAQPQLFSLQPSAARAPPPVQPALPPPAGPAPMPVCCSSPPLPPLLPMHVYSSPVAAADAVGSSRCTHPASCCCGCGYYAGASAGGAQVHQPHSLMLYASQAPPPPLPPPQHQLQIGGLAVVPFPAPAPAPSMLLPAQMPYSAAVYQLALSG